MNDDGTTIPGEDLDDIQVVIEQEGLEERLDPRDKSIAEHRALNDMTHSELAERHKVSSKTVQRTLDKPEVAAYVRRLQTERYERATAEVVELRGEALETLLRIMRSGPTAVAARIAEKIVDRSLEIMAHRSASDLETVVSDIEERLKELGL